MLCMYLFRRVCLKDGRPLYKGIGGKTCIGRRTGVCDDSASWTVLRMYNTHLTRY
jgi:hypothetical protein